MHDDESRDADARGSDRSHSRTDVPERIDTAVRAAQRAAVGPAQRASLEPAQRAFLGLAVRTAERLRPGELRRAWLAVTDRPGLGCSPIGRHRRDLGRVDADTDQCGLW